MTKPFSCRLPSDDMDTSKNYKTKNKKHTQKKREQHFKEKGRNFDTTHDCTCGLDQKATHPGELPFKEA